MADIDLERKKSMAIWPWILGLALVALLAWGVMEALEPDVDEAEVETVDEMPVGSAEPVEVGGDLAVTVGTPISEILDDPAAWIGRPFPDGEVTVGEGLTDRGFWIQGDGGERLFALIVDRPDEEPKDINPGQTLRLTDGTLRGPSELGSLEGRPLDADTRRIAEDQDVFLVIDERNIEVLSAAGG